MMILAAGKTDIGRRRTANQDSILCDKENSVFIVADGLGGHNGGEVASQLAIQTLKQTIPAIPSTRGNFPMELRKTIEAAGRKIFDHALEHPKLQGMGTTLTAAAVRDDMLYLAQVGDSRCYLIRPPYIWQLTEDHSLVQEQIRAGLLTMEKARSHQFKNVITRSLGHEPVVNVDIFTRPHQKKDIYLLCSDGLTGQVVDSEIEEIIKKYYGKWDEAVEQFVNIANDRGGDDNCSVIIFSIDTLE